MNSIPKVTSLREIDLEGLRRHAGPTTLDEFNKALQVPNATVSPGALDILVRLSNGIRTFSDNTPIHEGHIQEVNLELQDTHLGPMFGGVNAALRK